MITIEVVDDPVSHDAQDEPARDDLVGHSDVRGSSQQRPVGGRQEERTVVEHVTVPARREHLPAHPVGGFQHPDRDTFPGKPVCSSQSRRSTADDDDIIRHREPLPSERVNDLEVTVFGFFGGEWRHVGRVQGQMR